MLAFATGAMIGGLGGMIGHGGAEFRLSLAVSLPTMLVAFARYSRDDSFVVLRTNAGFASAMTAGSITGTILGGLLLGIFPRHDPHPRPRRTPAAARSEGPAPLIDVGSMAAAGEARVTGAMNVHS